MSATSDFRPGLEGVIAFETEIAEPDKDGGYLRYRGVDIEELVGHYPFENVWGLLVDEDINSPLPPTEAIHLQDPSGSVPADLQAALATLGPKWGMQKLVDIDDKQARDDLARLSSATLTIVAQAARGNQPAVPESEIEQGENAAAKFLIRWRGEADPASVKALDTYWISAAEHGLNASTFTARIAASTGADCAAAMSSAVGTLSGPLHGGAPARVLPMIEGAEQAAIPSSTFATCSIAASASWASAIASIGPMTLARPCSSAPRSSSASPKAEVAAALEEAALKVLREKSPDRAARDERRVLGCRRPRLRGASPPS